MPFARNNQAALFGAGMGLLSGRGWGAGAQGFFQGTQADQGRRNAQLQHQIAMERFGMSKEEHQNRMSAANRARSMQNQTANWLRKNAPEYANLPPDQALKLYMAQNRPGGGTSYGKNPVFFTDKETNELGIAVIGDDASVRRLDTSGMQLEPGIRTVDTGTGTAILNNRTGGVQSTIDKDIAGAKSQEVVGKAEGEKIAGRASALAQVDEMLDAIDGVLDAPGREYVTGFSGIFNAPFGLALPGTDSANFLARLEQLKGKAFLQAFETLKGGGQITEREGLAAQNAIARLQTSQSDEEFKAALEELRQIVMTARARISGASEPTSAPRNPTQSDPLGIL
ncbi:hypothetical protein [Roseibium sp. MMSF_3544]|uniref:hypothetical protein n=1 Tax=unclassified Roseibium TaxID=2629323 RepID=UPI00273E4842|nr:hypothetical protein [Roseibium sp. MMSF_3544]